MWHGTVTIIINKTKDDSDPVPKFHVVFLKTGNCFTSAYSTQQGDSDGAFFCGCP